MNGIFVTATGTDVGKTVVTAGLVRVMRLAGLDAVPMKPCQTGCRPRPDGRLEIPDLDFALRVCGYRPPVEELADLCPLAYIPACSPHLAAALSRRPAPTVAGMLRAVRRVTRRHDWVVAEGAGGVRTPLNRRSTLLDLMRRLDWPVLVVAPSGLGTLNATLLTLECLQHAGLRVLGVVLNDAGPVPRDALRQAIHEDNPRILARLGRVAVLGRLPWLGDDLAAAPVWRRFEAAFSPSIPSWPLLRAPLRSRK